MIYDVTAYIEDKSLQERYRKASENFRYSIALQNIYDDAKQDYERLKNKD